MYRCIQCNSEAEQQLLFCPDCWSQHSYVYKTFRPQASANIPDPGLISAKELKLGGQRLYKYGGIWDLLFPHGTGKPVFIILWGEPGAGKSTVALKMCDQYKDPALYNSLEEGFGASIRTLAARLDIMDLMFANPPTVDHLLEHSTNFDLVAIDSMQIAQIDAAPLRKMFIDNGKNLIVTSQVTKDGRVRGTMTSLHMVDVSIEVHGGDSDEGFGSFTVHKDRFGGPFRKGHWTEYWDKPQRHSGQKDQHGEKENIGKKR